jgi:dolichyl-diphosphooligosaccharide--protein glycosyltransferase
MSVPSALKQLKSKRISILIYITLISVVVLGVVIRLLPMQWGVTLEDYDPYIQYKDALFVVNNGFSAFFNWFDPTRWAPWGDYPANSLGIGIPFTGAAVYFLLNGLGAHISLLNITIFFPIFTGIVSMLLVYGIGSTLVNRGVGLFAALVFAVDPTAVQRTGLGFFTTEACGLIGLFLAIFFFLKALKSNTIPYSIIAGLGLAYMASTWGAYLYPLNLIALFLIVMTLIGKWSRNLAISTTIITGLTLFTLAIDPSRGLSSAIAPATALPMIAVVISIVMVLTQPIQDPARRRKFSIGAVVGIVAAALVLVASGAFGEVGGKFILILNPFSRPAIVGTVGEQFPTIWSNFFIDYHVLIILAAAGVYLALRRMWSKDIFMVLFALAAIYGAASQIRLLVLVAPAIAIISGYTLTSIFGYIKNAFNEKPDKKRKQALTIRKFSGVVLILVVIAAVSPVAFSNIAQSDHPTAIVNSGSNYAEAVPDWSDALAWLKQNTSSTAVVAAWWDYGYWLNVIANKTVVCDNSTTNSTQIQLIADAFLNNETYALGIFKQLNVSYVVVYEPWFLVTLGSENIVLPSWYQGSEGDFEKSTAMMVIAGYNQTNYIEGVNLNTESGTISYPMPAGPMAHDTVLYQMLFGPFASEYNSTFGITIDPLQNMTLAYHSPNYWVLVYQINYG